MPTRSEMPNAECGVRNAEWAARPAKPPRSIFGNYRPQVTDALTADKSTRTEALGAPASSPASSVQHPPASKAAIGPGDFSLQSAIDVAMARFVVYRFLAQAYEDPTEEGWTRLVALDCPQLLDPAIRTLAASAPLLPAAGAALQSQLKPEAFEAFLESYLAAFGHAARGRCPLNEIEYGDIKADPLFQPHRLADLAAFYRAFGLDVAADAGERHDHICLELEFMCVLAAKEAYALEHQLDPEELSICRDAQKRFLREHLGRWTPAFARRLARTAGDTALGALANLTCVFVEVECARYGVAPGGEDLLLRPVDEAGESMCNSCGVTHLPPGALAQPH